MEKFAVTKHYLSFDGFPLSSGKTFTIITENNSAENKYVQEVYLNTKKRGNLHFSHEELKSGSTLKIIMGKNPNKNL